MRVITKFSGVFAALAAVAAVAVLSGCIEREAVAAPLDPHIDFKPMDTPGDWLAPMRRSKPASVEAVIVRRTIEEARANLWKGVSTPPATCEKALAALPADSDRRADVITACYTQLGIKGPDRS